MPFALGLYLLVIAMLATVPRDYIFADELEARTGISRNTWLWWSHTNQGPPSARIGKRRMWKWSLVQKWLDAKLSA